MLSSDEEQSKPQPTKRRRISSNIQDSPEKEKEQTKSKDDKTKDFPPEKQKKPE